MMTNTKVLTAITAAEWLSLDEREDLRMHGKESKTYAQLASNEDPFWAGALIQYVRA